MGDMSPNYSSAATVEVGLQCELGKAAQALSLCPLGRWSVKCQGMCVCGVAGHKGSRPPLPQFHAAACC